MIKMNSQVANHQCQGHPNIQAYQHSLLNNITLLRALDLVMIGPIDLVILEWSCQGLL
jgi:hypothetical protein